MTVFEDNETIFSGNAQEAFGSNFQTLRGAAPTFRLGCILAGAHVQCLASSLKFTLRATKRLAQAQVNLLHHVSRSDHQRPPEQLRTAVDEARGCLGDIAELASQEFHHLQGRLNALQEATRRLVPEANVPEYSYTRRWKAKP
jgi:hypothetical protein